MLNYYPLFLDVRGKRCVVIGGGKVALRKVRTLLAHGASVKVISPDLCPGISPLVEAGKIEVIQREYQPGDLEGAFLAIAAASGDANKRVADDAKRTQTLINVADNPEQSDFIVPACLHRGNLTIAVSTAGKSPALARKIRTGLEKHFGEEYAALIGIIEEVRSELKERAIKVRGDDWQKALDLDILVSILRTGQREKAKATLLDRLTGQLNT